MPERERKVTPEKFRGLLERYSQVTGEEFLAQEKSQVGAIKETFRERYALLLEEEKGEIAEVEKPRKDVENELFGTLGRWIRIDTDPHSNLGPYEENITFGIGRENVLKLLEFALDNKVDPQFFITYCETTRQVLEWDRWKDHKPLVERRNRFSKTLFSSGDHKDFPQLEQIEGDFFSATNQLFVYLLDSSDLSLDVCRSFFSMAKDNFDLLDKKGMRPGAVKATSAFLEFMTTDGVEVFREATYGKHHYEVFGPVPLK